MEFVDTIITGSDANVFFGNASYPLRSKMLETTLRYIALKHHQGDIGTLRPIKASTVQLYGGETMNDFARGAETNGTDLLIFTAQRGSEQLPVISEEGWVSLDSPPYPVAPFLSKISETRVYVNEKIRKAIIIVRNPTDNWINLLCSVLFRVFTWYYTNDMDEDEVAFVRAISKKDGEAFTSIVNTLCERYDFQSLRYKRVLVGWNDGYRQSQIKALTKRCEDHHRRIEDLQAEISNLYVQLEQSGANLFALEAQGANTDESVFNFFTSHKQLHIAKTDTNSNGNVMEYVIAETLEYYDADAFLRLYENSGSSVGRANADVKEVLYGVFAQNKGVFRVEAIFQLTNLSDIYPITHRTSGLFEKTHLPHPHLIYHGCLGGNGSYINKYLQQGNWDMAIEQTIAAAKNINFGDYTVVGEFVSCVTREMNSRKCIIADNGKIMTPKEFLAYLRESKEHEGTENG